MVKIRHIGWNQYSDWGDWHREWEVKEPIPEFDAEPGDQLHDRGPSYGEDRVKLRPGGKPNGQRTVPADEFVKLIGGHFPPWRPPRAGSQAVTDALGEIVEAIDRLATATRLNRPATGSAASTTTPTTPSSEDAPKNKFLRLKFDGQYNNGDPYRDWELLVDVPSVPASRDVSAKLPHAVAGDVLREDSDDELTPFELRRDGRRIGDPEWWMVRHLFAGLMDEEEVEERETAPDALEPRYRRALRFVGELGDSYWPIVHYVERDIPELDMRTGDVVVHAWSPEQFPDMGGQVRFLSIEDYSKLKELTFGTYRETYTPIRGWDRKRRPDPAEGKEDLYEFLRLPQKWGKRLKVWHSRLAVLRVPNEGEVRPVAALSEDGAIFELLAEVGCRMPEEVDHG